MQLMSLPQHIGDLILPCPLGHCEISTDEPSSLAMDASTSSAPQAPQVVLTDIPQVEHV